MPAVPRPRGAADDSRPLSVLVADDSPDLRALLRALLVDRPSVTVTGEAADGEEAITLAAALQPDLIVLDIAMPVLDGVAALPRLRAASPASRVVMLSALPRDSNESASLAAGAAAFVQKAIATDSLIDEILGGAGLLDAAVRGLSVQARENFDADPRAVAAARRFVTHTLGNWGEKELADTITLLLSELVTNAIVHAETAPGVTVRLMPDRVHVEVSDTDSGPGAATAQELNDTSTGGRGLAMVEALSLDWGSVPMTEGKVVWFDVARA